MFRAPRSYLPKQRAAPAGLNANASLRVGLRAWWGPGQVAGNRAVDFSERGFTGTFNAITYDSGQDGSRGAFRFDGSSSYVTRTEAVISGYPFSMGAWFNADSTDERAIIQVGQNAGSNQFLIYLRASNSRPTFFVNGNVIDTGMAASVGVWQFVLASCVSSVERYFYFWDSATLFSNVGTTDLTPTGLDVTSLGRQRDSGVDFAIFNGRIEWGRFWNRALSLTDVIGIVYPATRWSMSAKGLLRGAANFTPPTPPATGAFRPAWARPGVVVGVGVH